MQKIIAIGETVLDIIIKDGNPLAANPGGSVLNAITSIGRLGLDAQFITELGSDSAGKQVLGFLKSNNVKTDNVCIYPDNQTAIALAYLDEHSNASYTFYKDYPKKRLNIESPLIEEGDFLLFGSSFAINKAVRAQLYKIISQAQKFGAYIYYDPNYRLKKGIPVKEHKKDILENMRQCSVLRASDEDFMHIFGHTSLETIADKIDSARLQLLICTRGAKGADIFYQGQLFHFSTKALQPVSTVGAGDNFNAGFLYALAESKKSLSTLTADDLQHFCRTANACAANVCMSLDNYISEGFANQIQGKL